MLFFLTIKWVHNYTYFIFCKWFLLCGHNIVQLCKQYYIPQQDQWSRSDGSWLGQKCSADLRRSKLLRGSSQREGASSALVVNCVPNFCYCFEIHQRRFWKNSQNLDFNLWGKMRFLPSFAFCSNFSSLRFYKKRSINLDFYW